LILPQEAFGLWALPASYCVTGLPKAIVRLSASANLRLRAPEPHYIIPITEGTNPGRLSPWLTLKGAVEMALLNSKSPWRSRWDRATVVPLRPHQRPLVRQPVFEMKKAVRRQMAQPIQANCPVSLSKVMAEAVRNGRMDYPRLEYIVS
jgi:hypothetical protein